MIDPLLAQAIPWLLATLGAALALAFYRTWLKLVGIVIIPEDSLGIVNTKFRVFGSHRTLPDGAIVALNGEAGWQAETLAPGLHFWLWPWQHHVARVKFTTVPEGKIGVVEARDGKPLAPGRVLARAVACDAFQNAAAFLRGGGERGPQIGVVPPGTYRINTALFAVSFWPIVEIDRDTIGIVTSREGKTLPTGEIAGREIAGHNAFQDGQAFVDAGGFKGLQEQVLLPGSYFLNPLFVEVKGAPMTAVPIAHAGVVIAYVGEAGTDVTGASFRHGNMVERGKKGVWAEPLDPGMYAINPHTHKVECVPTQNVVLNWATGKTESHNLDKNLSTITVRSADGFTFNLDVSQIIHIPRNDAPRVIARFGSVANLVTQVLEPTIGNYFRNAAQSSDVIDFLTGREVRQQSARDAIAKALTEYNVGAVDTLIGDITPPADLMKTLTDRKLAQQSKVTYETQRLAEETRKELEQAKALATTQAHVVDAERRVTVAEYDAQSSVKKAEGEARSKQIVAEADAMVLRTVGEAEATKVRAVGSAEADVVKQKIASMESGNYAGIEIARALSGAGVPLVPQLVAGGQDGSLVNLLLATYLRDRGNGHAPEPPAA